MRSINSKIFSILTEKGEFEFNTDFKYMIITKTEYHNEEAMLLSEESYYYEYDILTGLEIYMLIMTDMYNLTDKLNLAEDNIDIYPIFENK